MWSRSIEILNPYEAMLASREDEWARSPRPKWPSRALGWLQSLRRNHRG